VDDQRVEADVRGREPGVGKQAASGAPGRAAREALTKARESELEERA